VISADAADIKECIRFYKEALTQGRNSKTLEAWISGMRYFDSLFRKMTMSDEDAQEINRLRGMLQKKIEEAKRAFSKAGYHEMIKDLEKKYQPEGDRKIGPSRSASTAVTEQTVRVKPSEPETHSSPSAPAGGGATTTTTTTDGGGAPKFTAKDDAPLAGDSDGKDLDPKIQAVVDVITGMRKGLRFADVNDQLEQGCLAGFSPEDVTKALAAELTRIGLADKAIGKVVKHLMTKRVG